MRPLIQQVSVGMVVISPIVSLFFARLARWNLDWKVNAALDQFAFSPALNILISWAFNAIKGGVVPLLPSIPELADPSAALTLGIELHRDRFDTIFEYDPIWRTLVVSYAVWLPATLFREKFVPRHFMGGFNNVVAFVWNFIFASMMAAKAR